MKQNQDLIPFKGAAFVVTGEVAAAKNWIDSAGVCEAAKLFCQVMAGFELLAIWKRMGFKAGNPQLSGIRTIAAEANEADPKSLSRDDVCAQLGISKTQVYLFMNMAKGAASRLKKIPELKNFDPTATPINTFPAPQVEALMKAVRKLTNNKTQQEFGEQLGLWKIPQGAHGGNPNAKGKRALTAAEQAVKLAEQANEDTKAMQALAVQIGATFTALPDEDLEAHLHFLDTHIHAVKEWLKTPTTRRDVREIAALLKF